MHNATNQSILLCTGSERYEIYKYHILLLQ